MEEASGEGWYLMKKQNDKTKDGPYTDASLSFYKVRERAGASLQ